MWSPRWSNCFIWALVMQFRHGGYVIFRKSFYGWWPHAMWSPDRMAWFEYTKTKKSKYCPPPIFRGEVQFVDRTRL